MEEEEDSIIPRTRHLLLIDERLNDIDTIIRSINRNTYCMVFNSTRDTMESILSKVRFLNDKNRVMLYKFYSSESEITETIPTQISLNTNPSINTTVHCTPCDDFDMSTIRLLPSDVYSDLLISEPDPQTEYSYPRVFFQRRSNGGSVLVSDLDELYNIGIQFGEISDVDVPLLATVGIMQHSEPTMSRFKLVNTLPDDVFGILANVETCDPELKSWSFFIDFIHSLYVTYHTTIVDLMACALYSNPNWKYVIDNLGSKVICDDTNNNNNITITIRASNDNTGASTLGGNWIMETADTDLTTVYFTSEIHKWNYILNMYIDNRFYFYRWNNSYASKSKTASGGNIDLRNSSYTVEFWYYEEAFSTNCTIIDRGDYEYTIQVHNEYTTNKKGIAIAPGSGNFEIQGHNSIVPTAEWTHIAVVRNKSITSNQYKIYVNGALTDQFTNTSNEGTAGAADATFAVGMQSPAKCACNFLKTGVYLYDLRIYRGRTKTQDEIRMGRNRVSTDTAGITFNAIIYEAGSGTKTTQLYDPYDNSLAISEYAVANWKNTTIKLPNIGLLIFSGGLLTGYDSSGTAFTLNGTHFGDMNYTNFQGRSLESVDFRGGSTMKYCDLYGAALSNANFTSKNLYTSNFNSTSGSSVNLSSSTLSYSTFVSATLTYSSFNYANMTATTCNYANFSTSSFVQTNMSSSTLTSVNFTGCTFYATDIAGSDLRNSTLTNLYSSGVATNVNTYLPTGYIISSTGGYILGPNIDFSSRTYTSTSDFGSKTLNGINFSNSTLTSNNMTYSNFSSSNFTGTGLGSVNFSYSNLTNCTFTNAYLNYTNFTGATMTGVKSGGITTTDGLTLSSGYQIRNGYIIGAGVNVSGANLRSSNLASINVSNANFSSVDLSGTNLNSVSFNGANLTSSNLYGATINTSTDLRNATLQSLQSGRITGITALLPANYTMI